MTTPPITTRPSLSDFCLPVGLTITDAHLAGLFAPVPVPPPAPADIACVAWTWRIILAMAAGLFGTLCWGIYQLFN